MEGPRGGGAGDARRARRPRVRGEGLCADRRAPPAGPSSSRSPRASSRSCPRSCWGSLRPHRLPRAVEPHRRVWDNAVDAGGPLAAALGDAARRAEARVAIGVNEREGRPGTFWNTLLWFAPDGGLGSAVPEARAHDARAHVLGPGRGRRLGRGGGGVPRPPGRADLLGELHARRPPPPPPRRGGLLRGAHRGRPRHLVRPRCGRSPSRRGLRARPSSTCARRTSPRTSRCARSSPAAPRSTSRAAA